MEGYALVIDESMMIGSEKLLLTLAVSADNEVLRLICDGLEYDEIADKLDIAERTVKYHVSNILSKTGYANRTRLAIAVTNKKFIVPNIPEEQAFSTTE